MTDRLTVNQVPCRGPILDWFGGTPRSGQAEVLAKIQAAWHHSDVLVLRAPVGSGKSWLAHTIARWAGGATITTPTNTLVDQYLTTWPGVEPCPRGSGTRLASLVWRANNPVRVLNYYQYLAHRVYSDVVVFDEGHRLIPTLQEFESVRIWTDVNPVPSWVRTTTDLLVWVQSHGDTYKKAVAKLAQHPSTVQVEVSEATYGKNKRLRPCLLLRSLTPRHNKPIFWPPGRVRKLVFMSATFHAEDLWDLGLESRRVTVVDCPSPIPKENRPVIYDPVGSLGVGGRATSVPLLEARLALLAARHRGQRGLVHATYELARTLRSGPLGGNPRFLWHSTDNAGRVLKDWVATAGGDKILVACGMSEGVDLPGDLARWQAVCKITYPSLADSAVAAKARQRPDWYAWVAARDVQQATGRIVRGPEDWGVTYLLDSDFARLYSSNKEMFVPSFREALR